MMQLYTYYFDHETSAATRARYVNRHFSTAVAYADSFLFSCHKTLIR